MGIISVLCQAPTNKQLKGVVISSLDSMPIPYAHLTVLGQSEGCATNVHGQFKLQYLTGETDSLVVSHISFNDTILIINHVLTDSITITLRPKIWNLSEVAIISADSINRIVDRIKKNFRKNYPTSLHLANAFYREVIYNNQTGSTDRLLEATVAIQDKGYGTDGDNITGEIVAMRKSDDQIKDHSPIWISMIKKMFPETQNNFYTLLKSNPIRRFRLVNGAEENDFFGKSLVTTALERGDLVLLGSLEDKSGDLYLKLAFEQKGFYTHKGVFVVNASNYAIIDWEHQVISARNNVLFKYEYKYIPLDGKYYPFFYRGISFDFAGNIKTYSKTNTIIFSEHNTRRRNIDRIRKRNMISEKGDFYKNSLEYDATYWSNQNILQKEPLTKKEIESLSRFRDLEIQFKKNGK